MQIPQFIRQTTLRFAWFLSIGTIALTACSGKDDDSTPLDRDTLGPDMQVITPRLEDLYEPGERIPFQGEVVDNVGLSELNVTIEWDGEDNRNHPEISPVNPWKYEQSWALSGLLWYVNEEILVPTDIDSGIYRFVVTSFDAAGNEAPTVLYRTIEIGERIDDRDRPFYTLSSPTNQARELIQGGTTIQVQGSVTDNHSIELIRITLINQQNYEELIDIRYGRHDVDEPTYHTLNESIIIPEVDQRTNMILEFEIKDRAGNWRYTSFL